MLDYFCMHNGICFKTKCAYILYTRYIQPESSFVEHITSLAFSLWHKCTVKNFSLVVSGQSILDFGVSYQGYLGRLSVRSFSHLGISLKCRLWGRGSGGKALA